MADLSDIINTIIAEANGEGPEGMRRVGETILNRAAIRGISPAEVVRQPSQYTGYFAPGPAAVAAQRDPRAISAAEAAWELARQPGDPTNGADHYYNPSVVDPGWQNSMRYTGDYGGHTFYRSREVPAEALARLLAPSAPTPASMSSSIQSQRARADAISAMFGGDPGTPASGRVVASYPTTSRSLFGDDPGTPARGSVVARIPTSRAQSYAGQERIPATSASSLFSGDPGTPARGRVVGTVSTTGRSPSTRTVQSVPVSRSDSVGTAPTFDELQAIFGTSTPTARGTTSSTKTQDRLAPTPGPRVNASAPGVALYGGIDPTLARAAPTPRPAAQAAAARNPAPAAPRYRTETYRVENPAWVAAQRSGPPAGTPLNFGSRDTVAQRAAGAVTAANIPRYLTRTRQVAITQPAAPVARVAPVPAFRSAPIPAVRAAPARAPLEIVVEGANIVQPQQSKSVVQQLRDKGLSPSQAYAMANQQSRERARESASNPVSSFHERATSGNMWSAHD